MSKNNVILLLGTNLGNKNNNLELAKNFIISEVGGIVKFSNILENEADGFTSSNTFLNQMIEVETNFSPMQILKIVKIIEQKMGRVYTTPLDGELYVDRLIDIDILRFNAINYYSQSLIIPHHQIFTRDFISHLSFD